MYRNKASSIKASAANALADDLQQYFLFNLNQLVGASKNESCFNSVEWYRDEGLHGGGIRFESSNQQVFNRASINVSQVQYEAVETKNLASATALSCIIHPKNPYAPSVHLHISWTEMKNRKGYWRMMADLNPAIVQESATTEFIQCLKKVAPSQYGLANAQGDRYFYIPALDKHRGVAHFYLEEYTSHDQQDDFNLAQTLGKSVIDSYVSLFSQAIQQHSDPSDTDYKKQLAYHTLYFFQVLTLDRGTTSGLLIHDQNDLGILGSLPAKIDKTLLASFKENMISPQDKLLENILQELPDENLCSIDQTTKLKLANIIRQHYKLNPKGLSMQAQGNVIPATVENHS